MKVFLFALSVAIVLLLAAVLAAPVAASDPVGGCVDGFSLHMAMEHDGDHGGNLHVGSDTDSNNDGWICAKHVSQNSNIHVHIDNYAQKP